MHQYGVRDIEKLLGLPRSTIRALIKAGFVTPERGPRNAWLFSFQDLIVLRTAQALAAVARAAPAHHEGAEGTAAQPARRRCRCRDCASRAVGDTRRRQGRRRALAGRDRPIPARVRRRSRRGLAERRSSRCRRARSRVTRRARARCRRSRSSSATRTPRSSAYRRSRSPPTRTRSMRASISAACCTRAGRLARSRAGLSRRAEELRQRCAAALQLRRAARRHGPQGRGDGGVSSSRSAAIRRWPIATTTSRCSTRSSSGRRMRSGTWRSIGAWSPASLRTSDDDLPVLCLIPSPACGRGLG